jgi:2'-5' RNA ligase
MVAALELYLDPEATRRVRQLWAALDAEGITSIGSLMEGLHWPHMSLAVADQLEADVVARALEGTSIVPAVPLSLQFVGQFVGRIVWLGPAPSTTLLEHQAHVYERLRAAGVEVWDHYRPGHWVPHVTLSMRVPNARMADAVRRCLEVLPMQASLASAAVADHSRGIRRLLA